MYPLQKLVVKIQRMSQITVEFDVVGVDASIANAFRRILIAEACTITSSEVNHAVDMIRIIRSRRWRSKLSIFSTTLLSFTMKS